MKDKKDKYEILVNWHTGYVIRQFDFTEEEANLVIATLKGLFIGHKKYFAPIVQITNLSENERKRAVQVDELKKQEKEAIEDQDFKKFMQSDDGPLAQAFRMAERLRKE